MSFTESVSYDTNNIRSLADEVVKAANDYIQKIDELSGIVSDLGNDWEGDTYNAFKNSYDTNRARIEELRDQLVTIAKGLDAVADQGDQTTKQIESNM